MDRKQISLRLDENLHSALSVLSCSVHRSMNEIILEALSKYVVAESEIAASNHDKMAEKLRAYKEADPDHERAIAQFAEAEGRYEDPAEGEIFPAPNSLQGQLRTLLTNA